MTHIQRNNDNIQKIRRYLLAIDAFFRSFVEALKEEPKQAGQIIDLINEANEYVDTDEIMKVVVETNLAEETADSILDLAMWWHDRARRLDIIKEAILDAYMRRELGTPNGLAELELEIERLSAHFISDIDEALALIRRLRPLIGAVVLENRRRLNAMNEAILVEVDSLLRSR